MGQGSSSSARVEIAKQTPHTGRYMQAAHVQMGFACAKEEKCLLPSKVFYARPQNHLDFVLRGKTKTTQSHNTSDIWIKRKKGKKNNILFALEDTIRTKKYIKKYQTHLIV